jgi:hypothetical protein
MSGISRLLVGGEEFIGHDDRQYVMVGINQEEAESEIFVSVMVKLNDRLEVVAKYAIVLQQITR